MKTLTDSETAAIAARSVKARNFLWLTVKDRTTGVPTSAGFWDDLGTISAKVADVLTGGEATRTFTGAGAMLGLEDVPLTADLSIKSVTIHLSQIDAAVASAVRGYDPRLGPIQIYRGLFNPTNWSLVAAARCRFVGVVDSIDIVDPEDKGAGRITIKAVSQLRELTRSNPATGSDEDQKTRLSTDRFFRFAGAVSEWEVAWGQRNLKVGRKDKRR
jgi:hypothetical protein